MRTVRIIAPVLVAWLVVTDVSASGPLGIYGIVEKVVFEPSESAPERVQVWGAFSYIDGGRLTPGRTSPPRRGFLYFTLPIQLTPSASQIAAIRREWADLKLVAGTGQAIGFGKWGYSGAFDALDAAVSSKMPPHVFEPGPRMAMQTDLRVRPAAETPANPSVYVIDSGVVKLTDGGSHAAIIKQLRDTLR